MSKTRFRTPVRQEPVTIIVRPDEEYPDRIFISTAQRLSLTRAQVVELCHVLIDAVDDFDKAGDDRG